ncbi:T9SS type A sorting domain-containing protein [candidate division KSB1 bacterium]|nr:T9SS type A sorting domain-containing protein [candidate division KSB1 bacterium]
MTIFSSPGFARHDVPFEISILKSTKPLTSLLRSRLLNGSIKLVVGLMLLLSPAALLPQTSNNLALVSKVTPSGLRFSEVTGTGDLAVIGGFSSNSFVWIYDVSNRANPVLLSSIPINQPCYDVQVHGRYLFFSLLTRMEWYDILDPTQPKLVTRYLRPAAYQPHTFFVAGNVLYIADYVTGGVLLVDITDKKNPQSLGQLIQPFSGIHDITVIHQRLYGAWINGIGGLFLADVANPRAPQLSAKINYPAAATHNAWPTEDGQFILTTDEVSTARNNLKIWDARTPGQLRQVAEYQVPNALSPIHNVYVRGRYAYISYYCEGVRIVDIADPANPQPVAFYDFNGNSGCSGFNSNWGVYPFSNWIYASDLGSGLYVLEFADHPAANFCGQVVDAATNATIPGAVVYFRDEYPTSRTNAAGGFEIPWFKNDNVWVVAEAAGYLPDTTLVATKAAEKTNVTIRLKRFGTGINDARNTPNDFALLPNYPNPFPATLANSQTPSGTQIAFHLPQPERVQIEIFNIYGQRVRTLLDAVQEQGQRTISWNGADDAGRTVVTGVYILRLQAGKFAAARRMVLLQ